MTVPDVRSALPPRRVVGVLNVMVRPLLASPAGRLVPSLALLEFTGRRTGRHYRVPVGWHRVDGDELVLTPAPWRANFVTGAPVTVHYRGRARPGVARLDTDPDVVAACIQALLDAGTRPSGMGMRVVEGHRVTPADVVDLDRAVLRFDFPG